MKNRRTDLRDRQRVRENTCRQTDRRGRDRQTDGQRGRRQREGQTETYRQGHRHRGRETLLGPERERESERTREREEGADKG